MKLTDEYEAHGTPEAFYQARGADYRNPQEREVHAMLRSVVAAWGLDVSAVLDLACGSGEVTMLVKSLGGAATGIDPYTGEAYQQRTGQTAEALSFEDIVALGDDGSRRYSLIVCSFAMHLVDESYLYPLLQALGQWSAWLLILTPHKRPHLKPEWGWRLVREQYADRVRARLYQFGG